MSWSGWGATSYLGHLEPLGLLTVYLEGGEWCWAVWKLGKVMTSGKGADALDAQTQCLTAARRLLGEEAS